MDSCNYFYYEVGRLTGIKKLDEYATLHHLTARETETLRYLAAGRGDNQIAESMGVSYNTARTHVRNVFSKCGVHGPRNSSTL